MTEPLETQSVDYLAILKRRKQYILIPFISILLISIVIAFALPPLYQSSCTVLIEGQQIPADFIRSTVTSYAEQTIEMLTQQITSRSKLLEIINRLNLYEDLKRRKTTEEILEVMKESIKLNMISAEVADERTGRSTTVTIAFKLVFEYREPDKVQKVVNLLASLYLEENLKIREKKAETTSNFLEEELKQLSDKITQSELQIAEFKAMHLNSLPEMSYVNTQILSRFENELNNIDIQVESLKERQIYLQGQISTIDPYLPGIMTKSGRSVNLQESLTLLYNRYIAMKASYSKDHPDLIRLEKEIDSLEEEVSSQETLRIKEKELQTLITTLQEKEGSLSDQHLEIIRLKKAIALLEEDIVETKKKATITDSVKENPDNPAFINLNTQLATIEMELESLKASKKTAQEKIVLYQKRLESAPQIELEYKMLTRDYENALARYQETMFKLMEARASQSLEKEQIAERFTIIDPGIYPEEPFKPNRPAIIIIGIILALGAGLAFTSLTEYTDQSILSESALAALTDKPVLSTVSYIDNSVDRTKRQRRYIITALAIIAAILLCALLVHLFFMRLDILWIKMIQKLWTLKYYLPDVQKGTK